MDAHGDEAPCLPEGFATIAETADAHRTAIVDEYLRVYGVQFAPEVAHHHEAKRLLAGLSMGTAEYHGDWSMAAYRTMAV